MDDQEENKNIFRLVSNNDNVTEEPQSETLPVNRYVFVDHERNEVGEYEGFLVFTAQHVAVMREQDQGAIPVAVMPLANLFIAELVEDDD